MFSRRLNEVRHVRGIPAVEMAEHLGIDLRTYRYYESGNRRPSLELLVRIADYLDVSLDYLLCRDEFIEKNKNRKP